VTKKKPNSFSDLRNQFPSGAPRIAKSLVSNRYALEFRNLFAMNWGSSLKALTDANKIEATDFVVIAALEALAGFSYALDDFRKLARPTSERAKQIDELFWELKRKMAMIPGLNLSLSASVFDPEKDN
jgi:hypothetical protein